MSGTVLITGADGFLGRYLTREFARQGWCVQGLVRHPDKKQLPPELTRCESYSLADGPSPEAHRLSPDVVIHNAYQTQGAATADVASVNLESARTLIRLYGGHGKALFVFISSMSAHAGAYSHYGRSKYAIETALDPTQSIIIRPGFLIGPGGIFRRLAQTLARSPLAPMPYGGGRPIQTADVAELCRAVEQLVRLRATGLWSFGEPEPIPISSFYAQVAAWAGHSLRLVPVPGAPLLLLVQLLERAGVRLPLSSENLLGLKGLIHQPVQPTIALLGWQPAALPAILERYDAKSILG